jgi:NodT family efflux transporter outer membrane factor (OMF) lipoprotein
MRAVNLLTAAGATLLGACSLAPDYRAPAIELPQAYKEPAPWTQAQPADQLPRGSWWSLYDNARLSTLEDRLDAHNPDLAAALAHYDEARAVDARVSAGLYPAVSTQIDPSRDRQSDTRPLRGANEPNEYSAYSAGVQGSYDLDLWGKVRNEVKAADALTEAAAGDLASARLSLEAQLADDYVSLLGLDSETRVLLDAADSYDKALKLTRTLHDGGVVSGLDVSRAQAQLDDARAQLSELRAQRALLEHAIAVLVGEPPSGFSLEPDLRPIVLPPVPAGVPATLLQRRPDIAAAERRTAAANASIGVARAAFYPDISLSGLIGVQSTSAGSWLTAPSAYWTLGPNLVQYLFDGGLRRAELGRAKAVLNEAGENYRAVVLEAFRQVEDNLALLSNFGTEAADRGAEVGAAQRALELSLEQYRDGAVDYLNVVQSQELALSAQRAQLQLETRQLRASIDLIRALGGGWSAAAAPQQSVAD